MSERLDTLLRRLIDLREEKDRKAQAADAAKAAFKEHERIVWAALEEEQGNVSSINIDLGPPYGKVNFQKRETLYGKVIDERQAVEALEAEGLKDVLIKSEVRAGILNELVRERLEQHQPLPDGVTWRSTKFVSITRR